MDRSNMMESSAPEKVMLADYQLALKIFINKDIARSFGMVRKLQPAVFRSFSRGSVSDELYSKITTLYLTELGLLLKPHMEAVVGKQDREELAESLRKNAILDQFAQLYGSVADAPSDLVFHVFLVYYTCQEEIQGENSTLVLEKFKKTYHALDFSGRGKDRHLKRWFDMFVLNVLPENGDFTTAFAIAETNPVFGGESTLAKLREVQETKQQENSAREKLEKERQSREAKRIAAEKEKEKKEKKEKNLKFRSMRQIRADQERRDTSRESTPKASPSPSVATFRARLEHFYALSKGVLRTHSPVILTVLVLLFVSGRVLQKRRVNVRQKVKDTLQMAFKVTYL